MVGNQLIIRGYDLYSSKLHNCFKVFSIGHYMAFPLATELWLSNGFWSKGLFDLPSNLITIEPVYTLYSVSSIFATMAFCSVPTIAPHF